MDAKNHAAIHLAAFGDHTAVVSLLSDKTSKRKIHNFCGKSPLISCLEHDNSNYDSLEILLKEGWDPNHCLSDKRLQYKDKRKTALFFAVRNNDEDCVELLLQYGARVDLDPVSPLNLAISWSNFQIFDMLLEAGGNLHEINPEVGSYPVVIQSAFGDYRFFQKILQLGVDPEYMFKCPYGDGEHPSHDELIRTRTSPPFCDALCNQNNKMMGDWLMPFCAKFMNPRKLKLCSALRNHISGEAQFQIDLMSEKPASLKHMSRLKVVSMMRNKIQYKKTWKEMRVGKKVERILKFEDIKW